MKEKNLIRTDGRKPNQLREISITSNAFGYGDSSILFALGHTKVLCAVSLVVGVPQFMKGKGMGWLTAEYNMLPTATHVRNNRDVLDGRKNGRSIEISRLIGRSLRSVVQLHRLKDYTIILDCDVLQADGGTRSAAVTGACLALHYAQEKWLHNRVIEEPIITNFIGGISVGIKNGIILLDLTYEEDSIIDADYNFVLTESDLIIEIQGTAEQSPLSWNRFEEIRIMALQGSKDLFLSLNEKKPTSASYLKIHSPKVPLFSLHNRLRT